MSWERTLSTSERGIVLVKTIVLAGGVETARRRSRLTNPGLLTRVLGAWRGAMDRSGSSHSLVWRWYDGDSS